MPPAEALAYQAEMNQQKYAQEDISLGAEIKTSGVVANNTNYSSPMKNAAPAVKPDSLAQSYDAQLDQLDAMLGDIDGNLDNINVEMTLENACCGGGCHDESTKEKESSKNISYASQSTGEEPKDSPIQAESYAVEAQAPAVQESYTSTNTNSVGTSYAIDSLVVVPQQAENYTLNNTQPVASDAAALAYTLQKNIPHNAYTAQNNAQNTGGTPVAETVTSTSSLIPVSYKQDTLPLVLLNTSYNASSLVVTSSPLVVDQTTLEGSLVISPDSALPREPSVKQEVKQEQQYTTEAVQESVFYHADKIIPFPSSPSTASDTAVAQQKDASNIDNLVTLVASHYTATSTPPNMQQDLRQEYGSVSVVMDGTLSSLPMNIDAVASLYLAGSILNEPILMDAKITAHAEPHLQYQTVSGQEVQNVSNDPLLANKTTSPALEQEVHRDYHITEQGVAVAHTSLSSSLPEQQQLTTEYTQNERVQHQGMQNESQHPSIVVAQVVQQEQLEKGHSYTTIETAVVSLALSSQAYQRQGVDDKIVLETHPSFVSYNTDLRDSSSQLYASKEVVSGAIERLATQYETEQTVEHRLVAQSASQVLQYRELLTYTTVDDAVIPRTYRVDESRSILDSVLADYVTIKQREHKGETPMTYKVSSPQGLVAQYASRVSDTVKKEVGKIDEINEEEHLDKKIRKEKKENKQQLKPKKQESLSKKERVKKTTKVEMKNGNKLDRRRKKKSKRKSKRRTSVR